MITNKEITQLLLKVTNIFEANRIKYFVTGSLALSLLTREDDFLIHDIDIVVSDKNLDRVGLLLSDRSLDLNPIKTPFSIHANHKKLLGVDNKPFDISIDSFENYYEHLGMDLEKFTEVEINDEKIKVMTKEDMITLYKFTSEKGDPSKKEAYLKKLEILENLK